MEAFELNRLLVTEFPQLLDSYIEEVSWQEGDNTGAHVVYGDVFTPYLRKCIEIGDRASTAAAFDFIEKLLSSGDAYADNVVSVSVIESLSGLIGRNENLTELIGERTLAVLQGFL